MWFLRNISFISEILEFDSYGYVDIAYAYVAGHAPVY